MKLIVLFVSGMINVAFAQLRYDSAYAEVAKRFPEHLVVFSDRSIYAVNESIRFSALLQSAGRPYQGIGSKVFYAELVSAAGKPVAGGKFPISEDRSNGSISIPSNLLSGNYFLRCYTRWMRNFGPDNFAYIPIKVVNPFSNDVEAGNQVPGKMELAPVPKGSKVLSVSPARPAYHIGDRVEVVLSLMDRTEPNIQHGCITVVPSGTIDTSAFLHQVHSFPEMPAPFQFNFLPELNGTAMSGTVVELNSQKPAIDTRIHLTILGKDPAYFVTHSDEQGRFLINMPARLGNQEMFVIPEFQNGSPLEVHIDKDYTTDLLPFQPGTFSLEPEEQRLASRVSLQMQLKKAFLTESGIDSAFLKDQVEPVPFYGNPVISVKIDEFVSLPNLEEVIENLIPRTFVMRRGGNKFFMIDSENSMISYYPPLVLVDHIPVFDMELIMAIPPSKIDRIEVVPEVYIKGETKYGGIISLTSREGDLAGIQLPEGSYFFNYDAYQPSPGPLRPRYSGPGKIPDTRNTLFWMEHIEILKDTPYKISFQAGSIPGSYLILFRGVSSDGRLVYGLNQFVVKD